MSAFQWNAHEPPKINTWYSCVAPRGPSHNPGTGLSCWHTAQIRIVLEQSVLPTVSLYACFFRALWSTCTILHCIDFALNHSFPGGAAVGRWWVSWQRNKDKAAEANLFCTDAIQQIGGCLWTVGVTQFPLWQPKPSHLTTQTLSCFLFP